MTEIEQPTEDPEHFGVWRAETAIVIAVVERAVQLTMKERRRMYRRFGR